MTGVDPRLARSLRMSAALVSSGLAVQVLSLAWSHPLAFFAWAGPGAGLVGAGIVIYLLALLRYR